MFRNHLPRCKSFVPRQVLTLETSSSYDDDGVLRVTEKLVDASNQCPISTEDYTLSQLLAAGVSLQVLPSVMDTVPTEAQINNIVDNLIN